MDPSQTRELDRLAAILARPNAGLILDLDGAVALEPGEGGAPVVGSRLRRAVAQLLERGVQVALVSGRSASRVRHAIGLRGVACFGRHGAERIQGGRVARDSSSRWAGARLGKLATTLRRRLAGFPAVIEDHGVDLVVTVEPGHDVQAVRRRIEGVMRDVSLPRQFVVVEEGRRLAVVQHPAASRAYLVRSLMREWVTDGVLYLGGTAWDAQAMERLAGLAQEGTVGAVLVRDGGPDGLVTHLDPSGVPALLEVLGRRRVPPALRRLPPRSQPAAGDAGRHHRPPRGAPGQRPKSRPGPGDRPPARQGPARRRPPVRRGPGKPRPPGNAGGPG